MSLQHSRTLIKEIADRKEVDSYFEELLKDPDMRADMEQEAAKPNKWDALMQDLGTVQPEPTAPAKEMER